MINIKFLTKAIEIASGDKFRVLYLIANTISFKKENRTKIYREMIADKLNISVKTVTRLTNELVEMGLLKKDIVSNGTKSVCYYSLNLTKFDQESDTLDAKFVQESSTLDSKIVPLNKNEKKGKKQIIVNKRNNSKYPVNNDVIFNNEIENNTGINYKVIEKEINNDKDKEKLWEYQIKEMLKNNAINVAKEHNISIE